MENQKKEVDNPFPVKLGDMKEKLRTEAYADKRSLHFWIRKILQEYLDKKEAA